MAVLLRSQYASWRLQPSTKSSLLLSILRLQHREGEFRHESAPEREAQWAKARRG